MKLTADGALLSLFSLLFVAAVALIRSILRQHRVQQQLHRMDCERRAAQLHPMPPLADHHRHASTLSRFTLPEQRTGGPDAA